MPPVPRVGELELHQDLRYQRREWVAQRLAWTVMALVIGAALAGVLGKGPLSNATVAAPDGSLHLEYERFLHYRSPTQLTVSVPGQFTAGGEVRLWMAEDYLAGIQIDRVYPRPERVEAGEGRHVYIFRVGDPGKPVRLIFKMQADEKLGLSGRLGLVNQGAVAFNQFVYP